MAYLGPLPGMRWDAERGRYFSEAAPRGMSRAQDAPTECLSPRSVSEVPVDARVRTRMLATAEAGKPGRSCVVCLSRQAGESFMSLNCGHGDFHAACLDEWMRRTGSCPVCRAPVDTALAEAQRHAESTTQP